MEQGGRVRMLVVSSVQKTNDFVSLATNFLYAIQGKLCMWLDRV